MVPDKGWACAELRGRSFLSCPAEREGRGCAPLSVCPCGSHCWCTCLKCATPNSLVVPAGAAHAPLFPASSCSATRAQEAGRPMILPRFPITTCASKTETSSVLSADNSSLSCLYLHFCYCSEQPSVIDLQPFGLNNPCPDQNPLTSHPLQPSPPVYLPLYKDLKMAESKPADLKPCLSCN